MATSETVPNATPTSPQEAESDDPSWLDKILPIVRFRGKTAFRLGSSDAALGIYRDALVFFQLRKSRLLTEDYYTAATANELVEKGLIAPDEVVPLGEVTQAVVRPPSWLGQARYTIVTPRKRVTFALPAHETPHPARALAALLGDRARFPSRIGLHLRPALAVALVVLVLIEGLLLSLPPITAGSVVFPVAVIGVVMAVVLAIAALDHVPRRLKDEAAAAARRGPDRSGRPPLLSLTWGRVLRAVAVVLIASVYVFHDQLWTFLTRLLMPVVTDDGTYLQLSVALLVSALYLASFFVLYLGYRLSLRGGRNVLAGDKRPPILYLRSFRDDERNNLNPDTNVAGLLGTRLPSWIPDRIGAFRYIFQFHPIRFLRTATGLTTDTAEEQLALAMRSLGPFVAIGQPGERFAAPGAARMYVTHDTWKETVLDLMDQSQLVILQPAKTEGIWWEVEQTLTRTKPQGVVLCLVNFKGRQNDYEAFRLRVEAVTGRSLPRRIGNLKRPAFLFFDALGAASVAELSYYSPLLWPLLLQAPDLKRTLKPAFAALAGGPTAEPEAPPRHWGHGFLAFVLYLAATALLGSYLAGVRGAIGESLSTRFENAESRPFSPPAASAFSYAGKAIPYRITLDPSWRRLPVTAPNLDAVFTRGEGVQLQINAGPKAEALENFPETYASNVRKR